MSAMKDDDVAKLLTKIPRRAASPSFTERVLARIDETPRPRRGVFWGLLGGHFAFIALLTPLVILALMLGLWLGPRWARQRNERRQTTERLEMMRREYRALEVELDELRALTHDAKPVLDLGGTERVDFVIDLSRLGQTPGQLRAQPTAHIPE